MASTTTNIGLTKPAGTDQALISAINGNMDIIDTKMGAVGNTSVQGQITALSDQIATSDASTDNTNNLKWYIKDDIVFARAYGVSLTAGQLTTNLPAPKNGDYVTMPLFNGSDIVGYMYFFNDKWTTARQTGVSATEGYGSCMYIK